MQFSSKRFEERSCSNGSIFQIKGIVREIVSELVNFRDFFESRPNIYFKVYCDDCRRLLHTIEEAVRWALGHPVWMKVVLFTKGQTDGAQRTLTGLVIVFAEGIDAAMSRLIHHIEGVG